MAVEQKLRLGLWLRYWAGLRLAPHVGTPPHVAHRMLKLAAVGPADCVVDIGCGDARLLIAAAKEYGARGYGVELDPALFAEAERAVAKERLNHLITLERKDAFAVDLTKATVVTLYLSTKGNTLLLPMMRQQLPSAMVLTTNDRHCDRLQQSQALHNGANKGVANLIASRDWTGWTKLVTLREGVKQVWPVSAIDRPAREILGAGGGTVSGVENIWLVREYLAAGGGAVEAGGGAVSVTDMLVREALGEAGDGLAIDWLTRETFGDTTGDVLAIDWLVRGFLGDSGGELVKF